MTTRDVEVANPLGMHARAAARFVNMATAYQSRITVTRDGRTVDGKSLLGLLLLAARPSAVISIAADGPDEALAAEALAGLVESGFNEAP